MEKKNIYNCVCISVELDRTSINSSFFLYISASEWDNCPFNGSKTEIQTHLKQCDRKTSKNEIGNSGIDPNTPLQSHAKKKKKNSVCL